MQSLLLAVLANVTITQNVVEIIEVVKISDQVQSKHISYEAPQAIAETLSVDHDDLHFIALGDWGTGHEDQKDVGDAMGRKCEMGLNNQQMVHSGRCDLILSLGDNIYPIGVSSANDTQFYKKWKDIYTHQGISQLNWYLTPGNHDHGNHKSVVPNPELFQLQFSKIEPRWRMPSLAYGLRYSTPAMNVTFVSIDVVSIDEDKHSPQDLLDTLDHELGKEESDWKIVFAHYPCYSAGGYPGFDSIRTKVLPIMEKHNVDIYVTGHDHNLQHWATKSNQSIDHLVIGAGGADLYKENNEYVEMNEKLGMKLKYFGEEFGFGYFSVEKSSLTVQYISENGNVLYEYTRPK